MKRLFLLIIVFGCIGTANAQWHFTITSMSYNDVCGGNAIPTYGELEVRIQKQLAIQSASKTYSSKEECEIHKSIATMNSSNGGCYIRTTTSPCTGGIISGASGPADILAPSQGYSFYSTNPANEVRNWSSDDIERHLALNQQYQTNSSEAINTNDAKFNEERAEARENNTWYVDPDKPFVSVNLREGGTSTIMSEDYSMINTEWQFLKESQNIAEQSIDEYKDRVFSEAEEMLTDILETANMTQEQLRTTINNWNFILDNFYLTIDRNYKQGRENLEKALLLAKFKVDYKAILNEKYTSSVGESDAEAAIIENSYTQIYGKTRKEWYEEQIENLKKDLIEKGVSESDIELVISKVNEESVNNDRSSVAKTKQKRMYLSALKMQKTNSLTLYYLGLEKECL